MALTHPTYLSRSGGSRDGNILRHQARDDGMGNDDDDAYEGNEIWPVGKRGRFRFVIRGVGNIGLFFTHFLGR